MKSILALVTACLCTFAFDASAATATSSNSANYSTTGSYSYSASANSSASGTLTQPFRLAPGGTVYSQQYPRAYSNYPGSRYFQNGPRYNRGYANGYANVYSSFYRPSSLGVSLGFYPRSSNNYCNRSRYNGYNGYHHH
jgi:hypothetical protein